jgi:hypothetical protein
MEHHCRISVGVPLLLTALVNPSVCAEEHINAEGKSTEAVHERVIVDFSENSDIGAWEVEDDVVMGGRSEGAVSMRDEGHAVFSGTVSLENNGGFSSVQHYIEPIDVSAYSAFYLRIRGDGKRYQFLVESEADARHYYVYAFETTGDWQTVRVPFSEMYPAYRGDRLTIPNYPGKTLAMVRFFIGNKTRESFHLEIDRIWVD